MEYPARNNDCGSRLLTRHGAAARAAGRSIAIARVQESIRNEPDHPHRDRDDDRDPRRGRRASAASSTPTARPPSCTRTRSAPARASSPPTGRSSSGPASTPAARRRTSSSSASRRRPTRSGGARSTSRSAEEHYDRLRARLVEYVADRPCTPRTASSGPTRRTAARSASTPRRPGRASSPATCSAGRPAEELAAFAPNFTIINVPSFQADPATEGTRTETAILVHLKRMEVIIVGTEYAGEIKKSAFTVMNYLMPDEGVLPMHSAVNVGAARRLGRLLRAVGDRQDDAVGRSRAEPDRRRRARLGRRRRLQLRGRLLRQDDPPLADVRAGHLRDDEALRDDPRERRPRSADARARPRLRADHREHARRLPARVHRQRRPDRASPASRRTSSS